MRRGSLQILFAVGFLLSSHQLLAEEAAIDSQTIVARLKAWKASFVNLRVVWETRSLPEGEKRGADDWVPAPESSAGRLFHRDEWISAEGGLDLLDSKAFYWGPGSTGVRTLDVVNLSKGVGFKANFRRPPDMPEVMLNLSLQDRAPGKVFAAGSRTPLDGLYWSSHGCWLPELLEEWDWKLVEIEPVNGEPCARIELAEPRSKYVQTFWLDLQRDCLVRSGRGFIVDEFQQLEGRVWFPKRGRLQRLSKDRVVTLYQSFVVTEVELDPTLDLSRFEPPAPEAGTSVSEGLAPNFLRRAAQEDTDEATKGSPASRWKSESSAVESDFTARRVLILGGMVAGLLAFGFWLRQSGRA